MYSPGPGSLDHRRRPFSARDSHIYTSSRLPIKLFRSTPVGEDSRQTASCIADQRRLYLSCRRRQSSPCASPHQRRHFNSCVCRKDRRRRRWYVCERSLSQPYHVCRRRQSANMPAMDQTSPQTAAFQTILECRFRPY